MRAEALLGAIDMPIDTQSLGYENPPIEFNYTWRDTVVYALGVGASADEELDYLYEGRGPKVLPTFCTIPTFAALTPSSIESGATGVAWFTTASR